MTEPKATKRTPRKASPKAVPSPELEPSPGAVPAPDPAPESVGTESPPQDEQDRLREINEQIRRERELAGKRREQELRRRR